MGPEEAINKQTATLVNKALSTDKRRPILGGVFIERTESGSIFTATDSFTLVTAGDIDGVPVKGESFLLEGDAWKYILKAMKTYDRLYVNWDGEVPEIHVHSVGSIQASVEVDEEELIEGDFPNYRQLFPAARDIRFSVEVSEISDLLNVAEVAGKIDGDPIVFTILEGEVVATMKVGIKGELRVPLTTHNVEVYHPKEPAGAGFRVGFVPSYLRQIVAATPDGHRFNLNGETGTNLRPWVSEVRSSATRHTALVMPVKLSAHTA